MLLYLLFLVAVVTISLATIVPTLKFTIQRDREQEMIHRGEQYRRAIRRYYRRMGSYPATLDVLENTNDMRFLRKRYKDPINHDKDFKTLTQLDLMKAMGTALAGTGGGIAGAQTLGQSIASDANASSDSTDASASASAQAAGTQAAATGGSAAASADPQSQTGPSTSPNAAPNGTGTTLPFTTISGQPVQQVGGIAGIVGVASLSGAETIRIYNKKNHYKDWLFIYDPTSDRGGLLTGPYQPQLQMFGAVNGQNAGTNGFGQGLSPGMNNGINPGMNNGMSPGMYAPGTSQPGTLGTPTQQ
jgi:type II secretory pathway pseudopilin PulG